MASSIYTFSSNFSFRNPGVENKYLQQTNVYFRASLKILMIFIPICLCITNLTLIPLSISVVFFIVKSLAISRIFIFTATLVYTNSIFICLITDWIAHIYTMRDPSLYIIFSVIRLAYWKYQGFEFGADVIFSLVTLVYLTNSAQLCFRKLWADMETNKRKMMQEKTILNEIQSGVIIFSIEGLALTANHKATVFLQTRGINSLEKLKYFEIVPENCQERIRNLFKKALDGVQTEEEFLISHEQDAIPPLFSSVLISLKTTEFGGKVSMHMTILDIGNAIMRRRFLATNQRTIEENSMIIEDEFIDLYLNKQPLKNKHMRSLNHYLLSQRDLLVLMDNYLGESEIINEFFDIKNEIINTVHTCWRGAKAKKMYVALICEQVLPKQVFGDNIKHNQLLKSIVEFAILTGEMGSEISINCSLRKFTKGASIEYKLSYYTKSLCPNDLEFIFRIRKHSEHPKLLEEMIEISEKYGLGIAIFDVLLTITGGYVSQLDVQDNINRVIVSYVLNYENTKDTENPLRGVCLYKRISDGVSFKWGKRQKLNETESLSLINRFSDLPGIISDSSDLNSLIPEEPPESFEEQADSENRSLIQRNFVTSSHEILFDFLSSRLKS